MSVDKGRRKTVVGPPVSVDKGHRDTPVGLPVSVDKGRRKTAGKSLSVRERSTDSPISPNFDE